ncbi:MAG TPA: Spy/CpxP family protein refolding chaperone [Gammaproteobacteria bacterium]
MNHLVKSVLIIAGLLVSVATIGGCGTHRSWHGSSDRDIERLSEHLARDLELNASQQSRLDALRDTLQTLVREMQAGRDDSRSAVFELLGQPAFDRSRAQGLLHEKTQAMSQKGQVAVDAFADFYDSLDASQQAQLRERIERRWQRDSCWK